ncbi:TPA: GTPase family protein [Yersinia enterocolitica]
MSDKTEQGIDALKQQLSFLPESLSRTILNRIQQYINDEPVIGFMGKVGVGKSSLCNTLFNMPPPKVSAVKKGTSCVQTYQLDLMSHTLHIVDFPGIGEAPELDGADTRLYQHWLNRLSLIIWVLKADDRAWNDDIRCYRQLIAQGADATQFLFVLNQADKNEPSREWGATTSQPSLLQQQNLEEGVNQVKAVFSPIHPVLAVSASEGFNMYQWRETLVMSLPDSPRHIATRLPDENISRTTKESLARLVSDIVVDVVEALLISDIVKKGLANIRDSLLSLMTCLWRRLTSLVTKRSVFRSICFADRR